MTWLLWRQHRAQLAVAAVLLAVFALPVWITGSHLTDTVNSCRAHNGCSLGGLFQHYNAMNIIVDITVLVPLMVGLFWGATFIGRELETGTAALIWTQSVPRRTWIRNKLFTLFGLAVLAGGAVSGLVTWWSRAHNAVVESRFAGLQFDIQGVVPIAYTIFAAAVGLAAGVLWRRTLPAMATTVAAFIGVRLLVELVARQHYVTPVVKVEAFGPPPSIEFGSLTISQDALLHGQVITGPIEMHGGCASSATRDQMSACMQSLGYRFRTTYQPASRYWTFQWIETGIFVGLAAILVAVAVIVLRRRDA
ncbi:MAG TPA: hypothetical protein VKB75_05230 [Jatrophihabitans sp.]|nr:hypothetical protein [Jatrophihabitans sp.]